MWNDYRGGKPASEMNPPAQVPSGSIVGDVLKQAYHMDEYAHADGDGCKMCDSRRHMLDHVKVHELSIDCWCNPTVEKV